LWVKGIVGFHQEGQHRESVEVRPNCTHATNSPADRKGNRSIQGKVRKSGLVLRKDDRSPLGHDPLDVTLAYLKGKDAESEEAQEHANSSSLAVYA